MRWIAIAFAGSVMLVAAPASAQIWGGPVPSSFSARNSDNPVMRELAKNRSDARAGRETGQLTRSEARTLRHERRVIGTLQDRFATNGISEAENEQLRTRVEILRNDTFVARTNAKRK